MKKLLFFLFFSGTCFGQQTTAIADTSFEKALIELQLDSILDGMLLNDKVKNTKSLYLLGKSIKNLDGIEAFINLEELWCDNNKIEHLNTSKNKKLF